MFKSKFIVALTLCALTAGCFTAVIAEPGYVSVSSSMTKEVDPNRAEVNLYIETTEKTAQLASEKNKTITNAVIAAIKPEISSAVSDSIKTSAFVVRPDYYWTKDNKRNINGYVATNSIYVVTSNIQNSGKIIDLALKAGATRVDSFNLTLDNPNKYCTEVIQDAVKDTQFKAASIAKTLGTSLLGVKSINTSCNTNPISNSPYRLMAKAAMADGAGAAESSSVPIEAGKIKIYANVNASYNLK